MYNEGSRAFAEAAHRAQNDAVVARLRSVEKTEKEVASGYSNIPRGFVTQHVGRSRVNAVDCLPTLVGLILIVLRGRVTSTSLTKDNGRKPSCPVSSHIKLNINLSAISQS